MQDIIKNYQLVMVTPARSQRNLPDNHQRFDINDVVLWDKINHADIVVTDVMGGYLTDHNAMYLRAAVAKYLQGD